MNGLRQGYGIAIFIMLLLLTGCGFHLRTAQSIPPALRRLYFRADNSEKMLNISLKNTLKSLGIQIANTASAARYALYIASKTTTRHGSIQSINNVTAATYQLTAQAFLIDQTIKQCHHRKRNKQSQQATTKSLAICPNRIINQQVFNTTQTKQLTPSQSYNTFIDPNSKAVMQQSIITAIYNWLSSSEMHVLIQQTKNHHHANKHQTAR